MSPAAVDGNRQHPGLQWPHTVPVSQVANRTFERFLSRVLGILPMPEQSKANAKNRPLETINEIQQPISVACKAEFDECQFVHRAVHPFRNLIPAAERVGFTVDHERCG